MDDRRKTKEQLVNELARLRRRVAELEAADTERKQAEEALHKREELFQAFIEHSSDVITIIDAHGTVQYQSPNQGLCTLFVGRNAVPPISGG